jgi:hypothetical protein
MKQISSSVTGLLDINIQIILLSTYNFHHADKLDAKRMVSSVVSLLRAAGGCRKIILTLLPRYLHMPCCALPEYCSNMAGRNYETKMREKLDDLRQHIREAVHLKGIKRARIVQASLFLKSNDDENYLREEVIWGDDPIHMTSRGYNEMSIKEKAAVSAGGERAPHAKRAKVDLTKRRQNWVRGNV